MCVHAAFFFNCCSFLSVCGILGGQMWQTFGTAAMLVELLRLQNYIAALLN